MDQYHIAARSKQAYQALQTDLWNFHTSINWHCTMLFRKLFFLP